MYDGRPKRYALVSWIGSFTGVITLFAITYAFELIPGIKELWITDNWVVGGAGAFGAQSVLVFALPTNPARYGFTKNVKKKKKQILVTSI